VKHARVRSAMSRFYRLQSSQYTE